MSSAKLTPCVALLTLMLSACGSAAKPVAGSPVLRAGRAAGRGRIDDPRAKHLGCLRGLHLSVRKLGTTDLVLSTAAAQGRVTFAPTPGGAQEAQISGRIQGAEVIGSALLFPGSLSDKTLKSVEDCLAAGVTG